MKKQIGIFLIMVFLLSSCAAHAPASVENMMSEMTVSSADGGVSGYAPEMQNNEILPREAPAADGDYAGGQASTIDRMIIHNAAIEITVTDPQASSTSIQRMADEFGGFVIQSNINRVSQYIEGYGYYYLSQATINFRVPADRLNDAMDFVRSQVNDPDLDIANESISGQDVTKEYTDLNAQLTSLEAAKATMVSFLDSAKKIEDVMAIYKEIQQLDSDIERIKGEMKYYEESSAYSSINVTINQSEEELNQIRKDLQEKLDQKKKDLGGFDFANWQPLFIAKDALETLVNVLMGIGSVLIWILLFVAPVILVITVPIYLLVKLLSRKKKKPAQEQVQKNE
jgi:hypothetical protein